MKQAEDAKNKHAQKYRSHKKAKALRLRGVVNPQLVVSILAPAQKKKGKKLNI